MQAERNGPKKKNPVLPFRTLAVQFICSHFKAVEYFRASLDRQNIFEGTACSSYYSYKRNDCSAGTKDDFGLFNK